MVCCKQVLIFHSENGPDSFELDNTGQIQNNLQTTLIYFFMQDNIMQTLSKNCRDPSISCIETSSQLKKFNCQNLICDNV